MSPVLRGCSTRLGPGRDGAGMARAGDSDRVTVIWKPIPVRIFYTCVIYQGYDMDIPNANNLELHILVIYFLTFGQIFENVIYVGYPNHKYFRMSYVWDL